MQLNFVTFSLRKPNGPKLGINDITSLPVGSGRVPSNRFIAVYGARDGLEIMHEARMSYFDKDQVVVRIDFTLETGYLPKAFSTSLEDLPNVEAILLKKVRPCLAEYICTQIGIKIPGRAREALLAAIDTNPEILNTLWQVDTFAHIKCFILQSDWSLKEVSASKKRQLGVFRSVEDISSINVRDF